MTLTRNHDHTNFSFSVPLDFIFDLHSFDQFSHKVDPFSQFHSLHSHIDPVCFPIL